MTPLANIVVGSTYATAETRFTEEDLLLGVLWEGDLEIHSNAEKMKGTPFGERIVHGDSVVVKAIGQILKSALSGPARAWTAKTMSYGFLGPTYIDDRLFAKYVVTGQTDRSGGGASLSFDFKVFKAGDDKPVAEGEALIVIAGR